MRQGDEYGAASTYHQLGTLAKEKREFSTAGELTVKAIVIFNKFNDHRSLEICIRTFLRCLMSADAQNQKALREHWQTTGLDEHFNLPDLEKQFHEQAT